MYRRRFCSIGLFITLMSLAAIAHSTELEDDFRWMRGANYVASYAATDVEMWLNYDHDVISRELNFAKKLRFNCIRVFLQSLVYHHDPDLFLKNFEDFLATADMHGLKVMPILFDSCFGVSPSLESRHMWVANPGPDRMAKNWWPQSDAYAKAVVSAHIGDPRIAIWDVMNEPTATHLAALPGGKEEIFAFVKHNCQLVRELDSTHPITVGVAKWDNSEVHHFVDVLSCHSYAIGVESFRADLQRTSNQAAAAGKPWIVSECCNVGAGSTYEMALPVLREFGVGYTLWQVVIGRDMFNTAAGLVYPDGTVRRIEQIEAVLDAPAIGFVEKPDKDGVPLGDSLGVRLLEYLEATVEDGVTEATWRERHTQVESLLFLRNSYGDAALKVFEQLQAARRDYEQGNKAEAFASVGKLLEQARDRVRKNKPVFVPAKHPKATVYRDVYGIPHIWADSEAAAAYAMAIAQCEDVGMTVFNSLRVGIARQAEVFGENSVASDRNMLLWRVPENAEKAWRESPPRSKRYVQAFCDGLNDYRLAHSEECKNALPVEPPQILALIRMTDVPPSIGIVNADVARALNTPSPLPEFPHQSSTWVIGASRTASKKPIVFIDPHWPTSGNTSWWEFHLHAGRMQVGGFATPGMPVAGLGYTDGVAWGATAGGADSADAFELRINPEHSNQYWFDGKWKDMLQRTVTIRVKNDSGDIETRTLSLRESVHGPIVREHDGRVFAGAICGVNDTRKLEQWLEMNRSKTTPEFRDAIRLDQAAWLNLTYASQDGHIGYVQTGMCPLRASERYTWLGAHDGTRTATFWQGRVDFDKLPQVHDPESDWLQNCNTSASYVTAGQSLSIQDFPPGVLYAHFPYDGAPVWRGRGQRCFDVLPSTRDVTHRWAKAFAFDTFAPAGPIWAPALVKAYEQYGGETPDRDLSMKMLVQALRQWDYQVDKESIGATAFRYWRSEYVKLHPDAVGENTAHGFPKSEQQQRDAIKALASASQYLKENYGTALVPWGRILRLRRGELDLPLDGDTSFAKGTECLRATGTLADDGEGHFVFQGGQVIPTVVELTDPVRVSSVVPFGQSRRPSSPHYTDQAHLFSEGRMRPAWHSWSQLHNHVKSQRVTEYKGGSP